MEVRQIPTDRRREMYLKVMAGEPRLAVVMFAWNQMAEVDRVLQYCLESSLTGRELAEWMHHHTGRSLIEPYKLLLAHAKKKREVAPIIVGRDFFPRAPKIGGLS